MLFAAGFGTRMGTLTAARPKPLIEVAGRPLIDHALALTQGLRVVVNTHYHADQIAAHLAGRGVAISHEPAILDTGGGLKAALPVLGGGAVFTLNSDAVWAGPNPLGVLRAAWRPGMAALLLLVPRARVRGRDGPGDARIDAGGRLIWGGDMVYSGAQIIDPAPLADIPGAAFPMHRLWDRAAGAIHAVPYRGLWCDVGHPGGIAAAEAMLAEHP
ncbi:nucleotidyltransferase [Rhodobaculum claviforme]|uniref:Nucleotidyltransferase n=2 Tax=Rhodobaculum claviforme TaxID=1549854 RepID=A0A934TIM7_9RHOB|nr:nucleotidyltransferase [Rhodobaculum claviforme]